MKRLFLFPVILATFSACGALPISISVEDTNYAVGTVLPTSGNVLYPAQASKFSQSPINVASVTLRGQASTTSIGTTVESFIYGRTTDPSTDPDCTPSGILFSCKPANQTKLTGKLVLSNQKVAFAMGGDTIKQAVNTGKIWFGLEVSSGFSPNMTLKLTDMVASVSLF